jgi:DNA-binding transcriptional LysR family regulator
LNDSSLVAKKIGSSEAAMFASRAYLERHGHPRSLDDLAAHRFVLYRGVGGEIDVRIDGPKGPERVTLRGALSVDEMAMVLALVRAGAGIGLLPVEVARLPGSRLVHVLPKYAIRGTTLSIVYPSARHLPHRVVLLRDALHERLAVFFATSGA